MINKMADEASAILLLICSHEVWVTVTYDWSTKLVHDLVLMLVLMSTLFSQVKATTSCAYAYAYAYADAYVLVKTRF